MRKNRNKRIRKRSEISKSWPSGLSLVRYKNSDHGYSEIIVSDNPIPWPGDPPPPEIDEPMEELYYLVQDKPKETIVRLEKLKEKYPDEPHLINYLCIAYSNVRNSRKVSELVLENYAKNPNYLFAKLNRIEICLYDGELDLIPKILDYKFDLKSLYPERKVFHFTEAVGFFGVMGIYWLKVGKRELALDYYKILKDLNSDHLITKKLYKEIHPSFLKSILNFLMGKK